MSDILTKICADKKEHIKKAKSGRSEGFLVAMIQAIEPARPFKQALINKIKSGNTGSGSTTSGSTASGRNALIAEIKKASPSKGVIRADFNPKKLAESYKQGGATCLSVLTDKPYFQGDDKYIGQARAASGLPILRKDFMIDPYQVVEARAIGADCILLIMAAISDKQAEELENAAALFNMDVLIEIHNEQELERALRLKSNMIGINNRNLKTFDINLTTTKILAPKISENFKNTDDYLIVCESGIFTNKDIQQVNKSNVNCFLVGESLMRCDDVTKATQELLQI